jgi:hypothetical protein
MVSRMLYGAHHHLGLAEKARSEGQWPQCRREYRRAMAYYLPGNPWMRRAKQGLVSLAKALEAKGDKDGSLAAWRDLRSAILMLRGPGQPYGDALPLVNAAILRLSRDRHERSARGKQPRASGSEVLRGQRLNAPPQPHPVFTGLGLLGFIVWVGGTFALIAVGLDRHGKRQQRFWPVVGATAAGFLLFCLGMGLA